jgi:hypothetical protein
MNKMMRHFLLYILLMLLAACGSKGFRVSEGQGPAGDVIYMYAVEDERERVQPHLHYSLDANSIDKRHGTIELSFYFMKEQGDSMLWMECVEKIPMSLVDTALCHRWFEYY